MDRDAIRSAHKRNPCMASLRKQREWYGYTTGGCQIALFDLSRLHGLDVSANNYRTEHEFYIDFFFRHRWFHLNKKKDTHSLVQAWNSLIGSLDNVGRQAWLGKLVVARSSFEQKSQTGARYKLHRLSREAGFYLPLVEREVSELC